MLGNTGDFLDLPGPTWTGLDRLGSTWTGLDLPGPAWTYLDLPGPTWTSLDLPGPTWTYLDLPGPTWTYLDLPAGKTTPTAARLPGSVWGSGAWNALQIDGLGQAIGHDWPRFAKQNETRIQAPRGL